MLVKILKYAVKAAIAAGLPKKLGAWLKRKASEAAIARLERLEAQAEATFSDLVEVDPSAVAFEPPDESLNEQSGAK